VIDGSGGCIEHGGKRGGRRKEHAPGVIRRLEGLGEKRGFPPGGRRGRKSKGHGGTGSGILLYGFFWEKGGRGRNMERGINTGET